MTDGLPLLEALHHQLDWPAPQQVLTPEGTAPALIARLAREKIEKNLRRRSGCEGVRVGVLVPDPGSQQTAAPLAVVCEFVRVAPPEAIREAHRLAWNFCRAPLLVTLEPHQIRSWSCFVRPGGAEYGTLAPGGAEIVEARGDPSASAPLSQQAARSLHWLSLVSGEFIRRYESFFRPEGRADRMLLASLKVVRRRLLEGERPLSEDLAHDLIGRLIFIQFLFDRTDPAGRSALNSDILCDLHRAGKLRHPHADLASLLTDYEDAYGLFRWLDNRFNGDLFPGRAGDAVNHEADWRREQNEVQPEHLATLAEFVGGRMFGEQYSLWRLYSFDTIPLEFISCIYEEFLKGGEKDNGIHYTPVHLVDFVLDSVLPWNGEEWDLRILDPACGSGTFLVRAFQRLVQRWRHANNRVKAIPASVLSRILRRNLFGVEIDPHAARVASFSLYLAMCDEIDPRDDWTKVRFPPLRDRCIIVSSFFDESTHGFSTRTDADTYDIVVGNPPWGKGSADADAREWATEHGWRVANRDVGSVFLAKALELTRPGGQIAMIQPAGPLLLHRWSTARAIRRRLFAEVKVEEIVNFAMLRFHLFPTATGPACSITVRKVPPDGEPLAYISPKLLHTSEDTFRIGFDASDVHWVSPGEADDPWLWTVLAVGGRRDLALLRRLRAGGRNLSEFQRLGLVVMREGVITSGRAAAHLALTKRRFLAFPDFPRGTWLRLDASIVPFAPEIRTHRNTDPEAFSPPQLLIKQAWGRTAGRFRAALVVPSKDGGGVVCTQSFISVHAKAEAGPRLLETACIVANSRLAVYYVLMTSGRTLYRPEVHANDFYNLPLPDGIDKADDTGDAVEQLETTADIDALVEKMFDLNEVEKVLLDDAIRYGVPELLRQADAPGRASTGRRPGDHGAEDALFDYCTYVLKVVNAAAGGRRFAGATVFQTTPAELPLRLAAIHLDVGQELTGVRGEPLGPGPLMEHLRRIGKLVSPTGGSPFGPQRVVTVFDAATLAGRKVPTVYFAKPDQLRFWTRSAALRDADALVAGGLLWGQSEPTECSSVTGS